MTGQQDCCKHCYHMHPMTMMTSASMTMATGFVALRTLNQKETPA